jgi:hypothetical protein
MKTDGEGGEWRGWSMERVSMERVARVESGRME